MHASVYRSLDKGRKRESVLIKLTISDIGIAKSELYLNNYVTPLEISSQWAVILQVQFSGVCDP